MTRLTYYRAALAAPIVAPLVALPLGWLAPSLFGVPALFLAFSLMYAGVPYLLFALVVLFWSRGRPAESLARLSIIAPLLFAPLAGVGTAVFYGLRARNGEWDWLIGNFAGGAFMGLAFGYAYVALARLFDRWRQSERDKEGFSAPAA